MNFKSMLRNFPVFVAAAALALFCIIITFATGSIWLAIAETVILIAVIACVFVYFDVMKKRKQKMLSHISTNLDFLSGNASEDFPLPVVVCSTAGKIIWYNTVFENVVIDSNSSGLNELSNLFIDVGMDSIVNSSGTGVSIECEDKCFTVYSHKAKRENDDVVVMYLVDTTKYHIIAEEYVKTRPSVVIMKMDNMVEISQDYRESDCAAIRNGIEKLVETWASDYPCFITKVSDNKIYIIAEKQNVDDMIERKFDILDTVREYTYDDKYVGVTLSVGVGFGSSYAECESNAKLSIDMALGRGGDQAVIKTKDNYEFFGGISKSVEKSNKVKSRIVASALTELIQGCDNVFVMGHRFPDFDATGSAMGVTLIAKSLGKDAFVVTNPENSMAKPLLERAADEGFRDSLISVEQAKIKMGQSKKNLLVVVDTHIKNFVESTELLSMSNMTVVIDHHRKAVDYINDAVIFFHDPSASSTAEMVTELVEYTPATTQLGSLVADALLSGIMLDTKNFILRAGSGTFEAAAFLKTQGADAVRVKNMFSNDIDSYHLRNKVISDARKYRNCVIAVADIQSDNVRIISAQAADELLNISGVDASFVIFRIDDTICVSARSMGKVNVQVIMEYMNGGGHQTMAAAQVKNSNIESVTSEVMKNIDRYNESLNKKEV